MEKQEKSWQTRVFFYLQRVVKLSFLIKSFWKRRKNRIRFPTVENHFVFANSSSSSSFFKLFINAKWVAEFLLLCESAQIFKAFYTGKKIDFNEVFYRLFFIADKARYEFNGKIILLVNFGNFRMLKILYE